MNTAMNTLGESFTVHSNPLTGVNHLRAMLRNIQFNLHFVGWDSLPKVGAANDNPVSTRYPLLFHSAQVLAFRRLPAVNSSSQVFSEMTAYSQESCQTERAFLHRSTVVRVFYCRVAARTYYGKKGISMTAKMTSSEDGGCETICV